MSPLTILNLNNPNVRIEADFTCYVRVDILVWFGILTQPEGPSAFNLCCL